MVKLRVDDNKLYLLQGKKKIRLKSATIYHHPKNEKPYEITAFIVDSSKIIRKEFKQKKFEEIVNVDFREICIVRNIYAKHLFASGSKESPTLMNWYINYYLCKE